MGLEPLNVLWHHRVSNFIPRKHLCQYLCHFQEEGSRPRALYISTMTSGPPGFPRTKVEVPQKCTLPDKLPQHFPAPVSCWIASSWHQDELKCKASTTCTSIPSLTPTQSCPEKALPSLWPRMGYLKAYRVCVWGGLPWSFFTLYQESKPLLGLFRDFQKSPRTKPAQPSYRDPTSPGQWIGAWKIQRRVHPSPRNGL